MYDNCIQCEERTQVHTCPVMTGPICRSCCPDTVKCNDSVDCKYRHGTELQFEDGEWVWTHLRYEFRFREKKYPKGVLTVFHETSVKFHQEVNPESSKGRSAILKPIDEDQKENVENLLNIFIVSLERRIKDEARKKITKEKDCEEHSLGDGVFVRQYEDQLCLVRQQSGGGESERIVVRKHLEVLERLNIDGAHYYKIRLDKTKTMSFRSLVQELKDSASVMAKRDLEDVLSATLLSCPNVTEGHATFGVYEDDGKLTICNDPVPVRDEQRKLWEMVRPHIDRGATKEEVQAYVDIFSYWHPFEILPAIGLGFASPFAFLLRSQLILFPWLYHYAPESDLGKSLTQLIASMMLYGVESTSGAAINSAYRLAENMNSVGLARCVEEAEALKKELWPHFKEAAERPLADQRGKPSMELDDFHSRASLLLNGNALPISTESVLKRFLVVRYDSSARLTRKGKSNELGLLSNELKPIGFEFLRFAIEKWTTLAGLREDLRTWEEEIRKRSPSWASPKRPQAWANVYFGLKIFENGCERIGVQWAAPSYDDFVATVVNTVEQSTWGYKGTLAERFASWFAMWRVKHERRDSEGAYHTQGENEIFREDDIEVHGECIRGHWVTRTLLDEYNDKRTGEERIANLVELGKQCADDCGMPYDKVLDIKKDQAKVVKFGMKTFRAVFVPESIGESRQIQCNLVTEGGPDDVTNEDKKKEDL